MSCVIEKDCKRADSTLLRGFDLTWRAARKWRPGMYVAAGTRIRSRPLFTGSEQPTNGYQAVAMTSGWTGEEEPAWPDQPSVPVTDGSVTWEREDADEQALERTISAPGDVAWTADSPMTVTSPSLDTTGGQLVISALHGGGTAGQKLSTYATVQWSDGTEETFEIEWKLI